MSEPLVTSPIPRKKWKSLIADDLGALPEQAPEWIDALVATSRHRDASRLYSFADGREVLLPLVERRGMAGIGGWLQSYPQGWGMGGLIGASIDPSMTRSILQDLRSLGKQRISIRPDPLKWPSWADALDDGVYCIPRRAHVVDLAGGADGVWARMSKSARRGVRNAESSGVHIETGSSDALLRTYYSLFLMSVDRWANQQHEPLVLARARAKHRDPLAKLQSMSEHLGNNLLVTLAYVDGRPAAGSISLFAGTAHDTRSAMDRELVDSTGAGDLVQWTTLKLACERDCSAYHLGESGKSTKLALFKEKFGARPFDYAELRIERLPWTPADVALRTGVKRVLGFHDV